MISLNDISDHQQYAEEQYASDQNGLADLPLCTSLPQLDAVRMKHRKRAYHARTGKTDRMQTMLWQR